jgi:GMP synthase (glutamine-hydrolysing)
MHLAVDTKSLSGRFPVLGVCYGAQLMASARRWESRPASNTREYGRAQLTVQQSSDVFLDHVAEESQVWMSHSDSITEVPESF